MSFDLFAVVVVLAGVLATEAAAVYLQVVLCLFGATSALSLAALGGATVTPASLFLPFFLLRTLRTHGLAVMTRHLPRAAVWLGLLVVWGFVSAVLMPRAFAGQTQIMTVDRTAAELDVRLHQLHPVSGNLTQPAYLFGGFLVFVAMRALLLDRSRTRWLRDAVLLLAALNVFAGFLNLAEYWLGFPQLLPYLRTANYAVFEAYAEAGLVRIQGTFSETSAFSAFTLPLFAFSTSCSLNGERPFYSGALALASLALLLISTSGTAYTGLAIYLVLLGLSLGVRSLRGGPSPGAIIVAAVSLVLLATCSVLCFAPQLLEKFSEFFEFTVLDKLQSQSGVERTSWNQQAWNNFTDTWGIGAGLGSARASSFVLVLLSNLGVIGVLLFLGFSYELMRSEGYPESLPVPSAARQAALATLIAASVSGAVFDLGILFYVFAAVATSERAALSLPTVHYPDARVDEIVANS